MDFFKILNGGIGVSMSNFDRLWAKKFSGWPETELTGLLPLSFLSKGEALTDYRIYGTANGAGVATDNLFDKDNVNLINGYIDQNSTIIEAAYTRIVYIPCSPNTTYSVYKTATARFAMAWTENAPSVGATCSGRTTQLSITTGSTANYLVIYYYNSIYDTLTEQQIRDTIVIVSGSTAPSTYIPYGYKIPISNTSGVTENLLNPENVEKGRIDNGVVGYQSGTSALTWDNSTNRINYTTTIQYRGFVTEVFDVVPNSYYTLNYTPSDDTTIRIAFYNSSDEWLNEDIVVYYSTSRPYSITIPNDASKMRIAFNATNSGDHYIETPMLASGSTAPDHYIPHRYTSNYDLFIGESKLGEDEYLDYGEQKIYKRTENLVPPPASTRFEQNGIVVTYSDGVYTIENTASSSATAQIEMPLSKSFLIPYSIDNNGNGSISLFNDVSGYMSWGLLNENKGTVTTLTLSQVNYNSSSYSVGNVNCGFMKLYAYTLPAGTIKRVKPMITDTGEVPSAFIPYYNPTDPPAPLPTINTYKGENTLSSEESVGEVTIKGKIKETT